MSGKNISNSTYKLRCKKTGKFVSKFFGESYLTSSNGKVYKSINYLLASLKRKIRKEKIIDIFSNLEIVEFSETKIVDPLFYIDKF